LLYAVSCLLGSLPELSNNNKPIQVMRYYVMIAFVSTY